MDLSREPRISTLAMLIVSSMAGLGSAQQPLRSGLPATAPTSFPSSSVAPISGIATSADHSGVRRHPAEVSCAGGKLQVKAENSSLNGILRAVSRCTGMRITGGVVDQRVFGNYGPADPGTVLATLLDGTGSNMVLLQTASDRPAELILSPRTEGGATPPSPSVAPDEDREEAVLYPQRPPSGGGAQATTSGNASSNSSAPPTAGSQMAPSASSQMATPASAQMAPSATTTSPSTGLPGLPSIPQPGNNINGSPSNVSPTPGTYPTTNSVPLDTLPTPSTTPAVSGIVDAPNPPAPGSDTAKVFQGTATTAPQDRTITPAPTATTSSPGATNTATPAPGAPTIPSNAPLAPTQVYQQLQQLRQQQQSPQTTPPAPTPTPQ